MNRLATLVAGALVRPMYDLNSVAIDSIVSTVGADIDTLAVSVIDSDGVEVAAAGAPRYESAKGPVPCVASSIATTSARSNSDASRSSCRTLRSMPNCAPSSSIRRSSSASRTRPGVQRFT